MWGTYLIGVFVGIGVCVINRFIHAVNVQCWRMQCLWCLMYLQWIGRRWRCVVCHFSSTFRRFLAFRMQKWRQILAFAVFVCISALQVGRILFVHHVHTVTVLLLLRGAFLPWTTFTSCRFGPIYIVFWQKHRHLYLWMKNGIVLVAVANGWYSLPLAEWIFLFYLGCIYRHHLDCDSMPQRPPWSNRFHSNRSLWCPVDFWVMRMSVADHSELRSTKRPHSQAEYSRRLFPAILVVANRDSLARLSSFARPEFARVHGMVPDKLDNCWPDIATSQHTNCISIDVGMEELMCREFRSYKWRIRLNCRHCRRQYLSGMK